MHRIKKRLCCVVVFLQSPLRYKRRLAVLSALLVTFTTITTIINYRRVLLNHALTPRGRKGIIAEQQIKNTDIRACILPELDPFHESAMDGIKDIGSLKCVGQTYTSLENGILSVSNDVSIIELKEIKRVPRDDFKIHFSELPMTMKAQENENISVLYEEFQGNIQHGSKKCFHPFGGDVRPKPNTRAVLHSDCGLKRIEFHLVRKNEGLVVRHVLSKLCLQPQNTDKDLKELVFSSNCKPSFKVMKNGGLQHISSGLCVHGDMATQEMENAGIVMKKDCNSNDTTGLYGMHISKIRGNITIKSEFVQVKISTDSEIRKEFHLQALPKPDVITRPINKAEGMGLNVLMIMFDSTSAAQFQRKMRRSLDYLKNEVDTVFFKGESIVGDGTTAQLSAMLTGIAEENQVEARRGKHGAKSVDDWNWIFKDFKNHGYATMFNEDDPEIATFNYRLLGFQNEPTDHYARPFWIALDHVQSDNCVGGYALHNMSFQYILSFCNTYPRRPKFSLSIFSYLTHQNTNTIGYADEDLIRFLRNLDEKEHLNNSIVVIFGDHGYRFSKQRHSMQGKLEERLPFLSMTVPKWFPWKYPEVYRNLKHNAEILTSPFDVYATLRHVLSYPALPSNIKTGQSLFNRIDVKSRTCKQAGIDSHWCPCMQWEKTDSDQQVSNQIAIALVEHINNLTSFTNLCLPFKIKTIRAVWKEMPNSQVQRFEKTTKVPKCDSCVPVFGEKTQATLSNNTLYQLQVVLEPGDALFEASVRMLNGFPVVDTRFISRINAYGEQPNCIKRTHADLVKYCYCKDQLSSR